MLRIFFWSFVSLSCLSSAWAQADQQHCLTGAFLADRPSKENILNFKNVFGKKPYLMMVFLDWEGFLDKEVIDEVYGQDCSLLITLEPWKAETKEGIDFDGLIAGKYDHYLNEFALQLKKIERPVFLRFAHEPNGNWYPWAGGKTGKDKYIAAYRHVHDIFRQIGATNIKWIFCVNWEDVPKANNDFMLCYPGDRYVDYVGLDGYNWGNTQSWSRWMSFSEIFAARYQDVTLKTKKPVIISEFGSASSGGDKAVWIKEALAQIKKMDKIKGFALFDVNKEVDWKFREGTPAAKALREALSDPYFKDYQ